MTVTIGPSTPVEINQLAQEFDEALNIYREARPQRVLEIGTAAGGSLFHWLQNAAAGAVVVSVDLDMGQITQETADSWITRPGYKIECKLIQGDTTAPWTRDLIKPYAPFDWLFIDGCHEYAAARSDWEAFRPMCNPGAYVLFHDIALVRQYEGGRSAGVELLWRELQGEGFWTRELRAAPNLTEYGIGVLRLP